MSAGLITIFREVRDPRHVNARHDLGDLLFVALAAVLCGAKSSVDMGDFAESRLEMLRDMVDLAHGAPSHDTFSRVFRLLDPDELERAFARCLAAIRQELGLASPGRVVAVDGKSLRRGYDKGRAFMPPLMVNVFDSQTRLAPARRRAPGGSEVAGVLSLLKGLDLKGCTVTADALHGRADTALAIRDAKAVATATRPAGREGSGDATATSDGQVSEAEELAEAPRYFLNVFSTIAEIACL